MQGHVSALNAFGGEDPQGGEVLSQAGGDDHFGEILGGRDLRDLQSGACSRMNPGGSADESDGHRHLEGADQVAIGILLECRQGGVAAIDNRVGMSSRFDRASIVSGSEDDRRDEYHW